MADVSREILAKTAEKNLLARTTCGHNVDTNEKSLVDESTRLSPNYLKHYVFL
jgi:hypothetical protein